MENEERFENIENSTPETIVEDVEEVKASDEAIDATITTSKTQNLIDDTTEKAVDSDMEDAKWYVLHTFSGYENVAKENLEIVREKYSLEHRIFDIVIPMEDVVEEKNGKQKIVSRKVMRVGYTHK